MIKATKNNIKKLIIFSLVGVGILLAILALKPETQADIQPIQVAEKVASKSTQISQENIKIDSQNVKKPISKSEDIQPKLQASTAPIIQNISNSPTPIPTSVPNNITEINNETVTLKINDDSMEVIINGSSNPCEVLKTSLSQGKIASLNVKHDDNFKTDAVYQINGIGHPSQLWWTFKVNGISPAKGCSFISVNPGDVIEWRYVGS